MRVEGLVCAVTGGASGLGEGTARVLIAAGCKVAILDLNATGGLALARSLGVNAFFHHCDVTSDQSMSAAVDAVVARFGRLDVMVACAGVALALETVNKRGAHPLDQFERIMRVNTFGSFNAARHAVSQFMKKPQGTGERGVVVLVSSVNGYEGPRGVVAYSASKGAILGMTLPMARDLGHLKIRVVTISPGLFDTPMGNNPKGMEAVIRAGALGRIGQPREFGEAVKFVIESEYLTGTDIRLDGGLRIPHL